MDTPTPMLKQYQAIKSQHKDCILFFRLGDFYEMFFEDARTASGILDLVLTSRGHSGEGKIPMCGIPFHAANAYIAKLIKAGRKVAICEQVEDPALAKGIVKRDVIRVITSGTFIDETSAESRYIMSIFLRDGAIGIAFTDTVDGAIKTNEYKDTHKITEIIAKINLYECVFAPSQEEKIKALFHSPLVRAKAAVLTPYEDWCFNPDISQKTLLEHFHAHSLKGFGIDGKDTAVCASGALLEYLKQMNRQPLRHIDKLTLYDDDDCAFISPFACHGLEIDTLIKTIDRTLTPMGKRALREWIYHPLKNTARILRRQNAVTLLKNHPRLKEDLGKLLRNTPDIEKCLSRISCGYAHARDLLALRNTLTRVPAIQQALLPLSAVNPLLAVEDIPGLRKTIEEAVNPEVPLSNPEGKTIKKGFNQELDSLRDMQENGRQWLKKLQEEEIKRTKINSLKIGFTSVFGYYIEISKANLHLVPAEYIRKQTLVNAERFITAQLKEFEEKMLTAEEKILTIETAIIRDLQKTILESSSSIHTLSAGLAAVDSLYCLSLLAESADYIPPHIDEGEEIYIKDGRHPVVEKSIAGQFIPNDTLLNRDDNHLLIVTGPNMAGKSTYIRQNALLVILAQAGSFIPASEARIGVVDKIFTRIGAHDEIGKNMSTFMVEMSETADILNNLTPKSLIILDEIGRGTSTYDGLSLAWAIAEFIGNIRVRTLFATHFHELTALAEEIPGVKNYNVAIKEWREEIIFLHKIVPGGTDDSYGIYVARLAGIPKPVTQRAQEILTQLELHGELSDKIRDGRQKETQISFNSLNSDPAAQKLKEEIENIDLNNLSPIEALNKLNELKKLTE